MKSKLQCLWNSAEFLGKMRFQITTRLLLHMQQPKSILTLSETHVFAWKNGQNTPFQKISKLPAFQRTWSYGKHKVLCRILLCCIVHLSKGFPLPLLVLRCLYSIQCTNLLFNQQNRLLNNELFQFIQSVLIRFAKKYISR